MAITRLYGCLVTLPMIQPSVLLRTPIPHACICVYERARMHTHACTHCLSIILPYCHFEYLHSYDYKCYLELRLEKNSDSFYPPMCTFGFPRRKQLSFFSFCLVFCVFVTFQTLSQWPTPELTFHSCQVFDHLCLLGDTSSLRAAAVLQSGQGLSPTTPLSCSWSLPAPSPWGLPVGTPVS